MAIYKDKNGKWYISTKVKGKQCTIRGFESKRQAIVCYDDEINKWKKKHGFVVEGITLQDLCDNYFLYRQASVGTINKEKGYARQLVAYFNDIMFNSYTLSNFYQAHKNNYPLIHFARSLIKFAYDRQKISSNDCSLFNSILVIPKVNKHKPVEDKVIPPNHKQAFLATFKEGDMYFTMFTLFAYLGVRLSELLGICRDCVDLQNKKIIIKRQLLTTGELSTTLKTSNSYRNIPLTDEISKTVQNYCTVLKTRRLFPISHTTFKRILRQHELMAGIPLYSSHCFRHTRASELASVITSFGEAVSCAKMLGHSTSMFIDTYCHSLKENEQIEIIGRLP